MIAEDAAQAKPPRRSGENPASDALNSPSAAACIANPVRVKRNHTCTRAVTTMTIPASQKTCSGTPWPAIRTYDELRIGFTTHCWEPNLSTMSDCMRSMTPTEATTFASIGALRMGRKTNR